MAVRLGVDDRVISGQDCVVVLRGRDGSQVERARLETMRHVRVEEPNPLLFIFGPRGVPTGGHGETVVTHHCSEDEALRGHPSKCPPDYFVAWVQGEPFREWQLRELRGSLAAKGLAGVRADVFIALTDGGPGPFEQLADIATTVARAAGDTVRGVAEGAAGAASTFAWLAPLIGPLLVVLALGIGGAVVVFLIRNPAAAARTFGVR